MSLTKLSLESLVSDIPVGDGKNITFFYSVITFAYLSLNLELKEIKKWMHNSISKKRLNCAKNR
jgi:hypothetical protein